MNKVPLAVPVKQNKHVLSLNDGHSVSVLYNQELREAAHFNRNEAKTLEIGMLYVHQDANSAMILVMTSPDKFVAASRTLAPVIGHFTDVFCE